mmetsp:Transcript_69308/g.193896  ORF Transcript_69308/g.193896 Transcript_69308/m.193896 type:complete len:94 (-) Transcript_69308:32-313(-)
MAVQDYTACLELNPECAPAHFNRAGLYFSLGDLPAAIEDLDRAIAIDPINKEFFLNRLVLVKIISVDQYKAVIEKKKKSYSLFKLKFGWTRKS